MYFDSNFESGKFAHIFKLKGREKERWKIPKEKLRVINSEGNSLLGRNAISEESKGEFG